jgi:hypothetical protein
MSLFQFYSYIDGSLHFSGLQAHPQENSHSCSHNHWFSGCTVRVACSICCGWSWRLGRQTSHNIHSTRPELYSHWTNGCVNSCVNSPEDGPVGPRHVEIRRYMNKIEIVTSVGFSFHTQIYKFIYYSLLALHVSVDVFAHHQERLTVFTVCGSIHTSGYRLVSWLSWNSVPPQPRDQPVATCLNTTRVNVKQSDYRTGQTVRFPGVWGFQISRQSAYECSKVVSPKHRPPLPPKKYFWYSFLLEIESTLGPECVQKGYVNEKF